MSEDREVTCTAPVLEPPTADGQDAVECGEPVPWETQVCPEHDREQITTLIEQNGRLIDYAAQQDAVVAYLVMLAGGEVRIPPLDEVELPENIGASVDEVTGWMTLRTSSDLPNT
jgi:hypothetical protein